MIKKIILSAFLSVLMVFSMAGNVFADGYGKEVDIKVMSYNIQHGAGLDDELDLERTARVIENAEADIVGIQEVDRFYGERSDFQDQAKELAQLLGYHYVYAPNLNLEPDNGQDKNRQYGTAILSKYPIIDSEHTLLSSLGNEQRGLLHAKINVRGVYVNFYNTHLGLSVPERLTQVEEITEIASSFDGPSVLVGDLNAEPDSDEFKLLLEQGNLIDSFADVDHANTFPVLNPIKRIDYILTSPEIDFSNQEVIDTEASDHLPIVTDLIISR